MSEKLPSEILCVHADGKRAACLFHFGARLPAEGESNPIYAAAVAGLRAEGRRPVQITNLEGEGGTSAMRGMFRAILVAADRQAATDIVAIVSPGAARAYCAVLGFDDLLPDEPPRDWELARDILGKSLPTRLIRLRLDEVKPERLNML